MQEIAQGTFTYEHFTEVMSMLWKRMLQDNKKNWRRTYKVILNVVNTFTLCCNTPVISCLRITLFLNTFCFRM
jgi:hypothetical protein